MRGVALLAVQRLLGHSSIVVTQRYAHLVPQMTRDAVLLLDPEPAHPTAPAAVAAAA
jgi:site-specific recombinase XerD